MTFAKWLNTLVDEKGLDTEASFTIIDREDTTNWMPLGVVLEAIQNASVAEQAKIKTTLVKIDFCNGNIMDYFRFLGECLINARLDRMETA